MKTLLTIFLAAAGLVSQAQTRLKTDSVYLSGKITDFAKHLDSANDVKVYVNDLALGTQLNYRTKIKPDGTYRLAFIKTGAQDVYIEYNQDLVTILVTPGSHTQINFDADRFEETLTFKGDDARPNQEMMAYDKAVTKRNQQLYGQDQSARFRELSAAQKNNQPDAYSTYLKKRYTQDSTFLAVYLSRHQLTPLFTQWAKASLLCEYWTNLMRYRWVYPLQNKIERADFKMPDSYFDFTKTIDINNPRLAVSSYYGNFIKEYSGYLYEKMFSQKSSPEEEVNLYFGMPAGLAKDVLLCNLFWRKIDGRQVGFFSRYVNRFKQTVTEPVLKASILKAYAAELRRQKDLAARFVPGKIRVSKTEADEVFDGIIKQYKGKVVYIDFWATWCEPCMHEMPASKVLHDKYEGKDVIFLYLASQSPEETWKTTIAREGIKGEHLLLTANQYSALQEKFQISGIPRYVLVDKAGRVTDGNARRPSDQDLPADIDKLLAAN